MDKYRRIQCTKALKGNERHPSHKKTKLLTTSNKLRTKIILTLHNPTNTAI